MANMLILAPAEIALLTASRGDGADNLVRPDPKEVWSDRETGAVRFDIDLGTTMSIDTVAAISIYGASADAAWTVSAGIAGPNELTVRDTAPLCAPSSVMKRPADHGLSFGDAFLCRYLRITVTQGAGAQPLSIGRMIVGKAFQPTWNREWGSGRRVIDLSTVTALPGGGFGIAHGARKSGFAWTFGDLTDDETRQLHAMALELGESGPVLVVEDPASASGLREAMHYGLFRGLKAYERRNVQQTRWDFTVEGWV